VKVVPKGDCREWDSGKRKDKQIVITNQIVISGQPLSRSSSEVPE